MRMFLLLLFSGIASTVFIIGLFDVIREMARQAKDMQLLSESLKVEKRIRKVLKRNARIQ